MRNIGLLLQKEWLEFMLAVIAGLAIWGVTALFQREVILTKWS